LYTPTLTAPSVIEKNYGAAIQAFLRVSWPSEVAGHHNSGMLAIADIATMEAIREI
jgi:hypothetical protein